MYNEKAYKSQIFWLKIKRIVIITLYTIAGVSLGVFTSFYLIDLSMLDNSFRAPTVALPTIVFFLLSLLFTANIGKDIQEAYWNIELIEKLNNISDKLDNVETLDKKDIALLKNVNTTIVRKKVKKIPKEDPTFKVDILDDNYDETDANNDIKKDIKKINKKQEDITSNVPIEKNKEITMTHKKVEKQIEPKIKVHTSSTHHETVKTKIKNENDIKQVSHSKKEIAEDDLLDNLYVKNPTAASKLTETTKPIHKTQPFRNVDFSKKIAEETTNVPTKTKKVVRKKKIPLIPAMANLEIDDVYEFEEDDDDNN